MLNNRLNVPSGKPVTSARELYLAGVLLVASGFFHVLVWLFLGGDWEGSISWRKPILFGISTGATLISIAWFFDKLRPAKWDKTLCRVLSISLVLEVALITLQQWRGQASHFNHGSSLNSLIEYSMTALIVIATLVLLQIAWRSFSDLDAEPDIRLAIQAGMGFLLVSCLIGFWVLFNGQYQVSIGREPSTFGNAGVPKFPHGVAIHALQMFPLLCWLFRKLNMPPSQRIRLIILSVLSMGVMLAFSLLQTLLGRSRFDMDSISASILAVSVVLAAPVIWAIFRATDYPKRKLASKSPMRRGPTSKTYESNS